MKKILFILPTLPYPLEFGGNQAMYNGIAAITENAEVYITYSSYHKDNAKLRNDFVKSFDNKVKVFPYYEKRILNSLRKIVYRIVDILDNRVFKKDKDCILNKEFEIKQPSENEIVFINKIIKEYAIEIVQVEMMSHLTIINSLPTNVKKVFVHHELKFVRNSQILKEICESEYYRSISLSMKTMEIGLLNKYDDIIVLSEIDKKKLMEAGVNAPIHTSFAIVKQPQHFLPITEDYHTIFFIGPSKHRPNYMGIKWFLENCWNKLLQTDERFVLKIIGRWDKNSIKNISTNYKQVDFLGFVDSLSDVLANGIMIVPINIGSGIRMKILEAAANGIPVVSTTIGAEGLPLKDGVNCFLADTPQLFIDSILRLNDKTLRLRFIDDLHNIIQNQYTFEQLKVNRRQILGL